MRTFTFLLFLLLLPFSAHGQMNPRSVIDGNNSSTQVLASAATFTGSWVNVLEFADVITTVTTDQNGMLYIDFSPDGVNVDSSLSFDFRAGIVETPHRLKIYRPYYRVRFTNTGESAQTYLRLQSLLLNNSGLLSTPLNSLIGYDADAIMVRSRPVEYDIVSGKMEGFSVVNKFGKNSAVSAPTDLWEAGGVYTGFNAVAAQQIQIFSSDANDASPSGTGARTVVVSGLDGNYNQISETVALNGTTPVTTTQTFLRAHTARVATSGSLTAFNAGNITFRQATTTANVFLFMRAGVSQTNNSGYTVPAGKTAYMRDLHGSIRGGNNVSVDGSIWVRTNGGAPRLRRPFTIGPAARLNDVIYGGLVFTEKTDIILRITGAGTPTPEVVGGYDLILVDN